MVQQEANGLLPEFRTKSMEAQKKVISHFEKSIRLSHHSANHNAQTNPKRTKNKSTDFNALMKEKVACVNPEDILKMDQKPIPF